MELERLITDIWASVLKVDSIQPTDNFFELGGDSLGTLRVLSGLRKRGIAVKPADLRRHQTVAELAAVLAGEPLGAAATTPAPPEDHAAAGPQIFPLLPVQHRFLEWRMGDHNHYNIALLADSTVAGGLSKDALDKALGDLLVRHDGLRCRLTRRDGRPAQRLAPVEELPPVEWHEQSDLSAAAQDEEALAVMERLQQSLNVESGPVLAVAAFRRHHADRLFLLLHHMFVDALSAAVVAEDLSTLYAQHAGLVTTDTLPPPCTPVREHAQAVESLVQSGKLAEAERAWLSLPWAGAGPIPVRDKSGSLDYQHLTRYVVEVDSATTQGLLQAPRTSGATVEEVLAYALAVSTTQLSGRNVAHFEMCQHGRRPIGDGHDLSRTVGWMFTVAPYVLRVRGTDGLLPVAQVLEQIRHIKEMEHTWGPLRYVGSAGAAGQGVGTLPLPDVYMNYHGVEGLTPPWQSPFTGASAPTGAYVSDQGEQQYPIKLWAEISNQRLELVWWYSTERHDSETVVALSAAFVTALRQATDQGSA